MPYPSQNTTRKLTQNTLHYVILYTFHLTETLSALHLIISAEARPLLSQEPLFLPPLPLFMKKCRSPVHAKRKSAVLVTGPLSKGFFSLGDQTHADALPMDTTKTTNWFYFLSNIELMTAEENHTVICYGDSITAGAWPDYLTLLARQNPDNHTAFIRRATSGSRVLRQYECITYDSYGLKGTNRFPHEIPTTGADTVIIQQGINDIIHPIGIETNPFRPMSDLPTAKELIDGYRYYIEEAKKLHLKVYMGTLLPIFGWRTYATFRDDLRNELNAWIRSAKEIDGCIDFDLALRGSENPSAFREGFDSGDHLHPSSKAYQAMAECAYEVLRK